MTWLSSTGSGCREKTIYDTVDSLKTGDVVLKGANAFDLYGHAAVQIGDAQGGTIHATLAAVDGRRVQLIVPVGVEKRVFEMSANWQATRTRRTLQGHGSTRFRALSLPSWMLSRCSPARRPCWSPPAASMVPKGRRGSGSAARRSSKQPPRA